jgi:hypothetical protein
MKKIGRGQSTLLAALFPLGPFCVFVIAIVVFFGLFVSIGLLSDDVETAGFAALFLFIPVSAILLILLFIIFWRRLRRISRAAPWFPLLGILIFILASFAFALPRLSSMGYGFGVMRTLNNVFLTPIFVFTDGLDSEILGQLIVPWLVTILSGFVAVFLSRRFGSPQEMGDG